MVQPVEPPAATATDAQATDHKTSDSADAAPAPSPARPSADALAQSLVGDTNVQLRDTRFVIGDWISIAVLPPLPTGDVAPLPAPPSGSAPGAHAQGRSREQQHGSRAQGVGRDEAGRDGGSGPWGRRYGSGGHRERDYGRNYRERDYGRDHGRRHSRSPGRGYRPHEREYEAADRGYANGAPRERDASYGYPGGAYHGRSIPSSNWRRGEVPRGGYYSGSGGRNAPARGGW